MSRSARGESGFTLLEVMISLAILAVSLVAISGLTGGAVAMEAYSRRATEATLLLRAKMTDLEDQLHKDGFSDFDDEKRGSFEEEGSPGTGDSHFFLVGHFEKDVAFVADLDDGDLVEIDVGLFVLAETLLGLGFHIHGFCLKRSELLLL